MTRPMINERRFFEHIAPYIGDTKRVVEEAIENAVRSKASRVEVFYESSGDEATIRIVNDGENLEDFSRLFVVAESGYDAAVIKEHKPAGMGVLMMLASAEEVLFRSGAKEILVETKKFFKGERYRSTLLGRLRPAAKYVDGFETIIRGKASKLSEAVEKVQARSHRYPVKIFVNGEEVPPVRINAVAEKMGEGILEGCRVHFLGFGKKGPFGMDMPSGDIFWHGKQLERFEYFSIEVIGENGFLKPRLPDRTSLVISSAERKELLEACKALFAEAIEAEFDRLLDVNDKESCELVEYAISRGFGPKKPLGSRPAYWNGISREDVKADRVLVVEDSQMADIACYVEGEKSWENKENEIAKLKVDDLELVEAYPKASNLVPEWYAALEPQTLRIELHTTKRLQKASIVAKNNEYLVVEKAIVNGKETGLFLFDMEDSIFMSTSEHLDQHAVADVVCDVYENRNYDDEVWRAESDIRAIEEMIDGRLKSGRNILSDVKNAVEAIHGIEIAVERIEVERNENGVPTAIVVNGEYKVGI